ncbi:hypothetical protein ACO0QE_000746 [Hanseniaspora vineae]
MNLNDEFFKSMKAVSSLQERYQLSRQDMMDLHAFNITVFETPSEDFDDMMNFMRIYYSQKTGTPDDLKVIAAKTDSLLKSKCKNSKKKRVKMKVSMSGNDIIVNNKVAFTVEKINGEEKVTRVKHVNPQPTSVQSDIE